MSEQHRQRVVVCYVTSVCMPFGPSQPRTRHLVSAAACCFACPFVGFVCCVCVGQDVRIYLCASSDHSQIGLIFSPCVRFLNKLWSQDYLQQTISEQLIQLEHWLRIQTFLYAHTQEESDVHTPTRSATHRRTGTYTLRRAWSWRCVLCNSRVKWSQNTHQTLATAEAASLVRGGGVRGSPTLMMSSDQNMCHRQSLASSTFQFLSCRGRICAVLLNEISCVATVMLQ